MVPSIPLKVEDQDLMIFLYKSIGLVDRFRYKYDSSQRDQVMDPRLLDSFGLSPIVSFLRRILDRQISAAPSKRPGREEQRDGGPGGDPREPWQTS